MNLRSFCSEVEVDVVDSLVLVLSLRWRLASRSSFELDVVLLLGVVGIMGSGVCSEGVSIRVVFDEEGVWVVGLLDDDVDVDVDAVSGSISLEMFRLSKESCRAGVGDVGVGVGVLESS